MAEWITAGRSPKSNEWSPPRAGARTGTLTQHDHLNVTNQWRRLVLRPRARPPSVGDNFCASPLQSFALMYSLDIRKLGFRRTSLLDQRSKSPSRRGLLNVHRIRNCRKPLELLPPNRPRSRRSIQPRSTRRNRRRSYHTTSDRSPGDRNSRRHRPSQRKTVRIERGNKAGYRGRHTGRSILYYNHALVIEQKHYTRQTR